MRDWIRRRANAVRAQYSAYDALVELGITDIIDESTPTKLFCPFHSNTNTPAAHYYPTSGGRPDYMRCYGSCKENFDSINLVAKARGKKFMDALIELERRFRIHIPKRPELPEYVEPTERGSNYDSDAWADVPRVLALLEKKLLGIRDICSFQDYVKYCRVLDAVEYDYNKISESTPEMVKILRKLFGRIEESIMLNNMKETDESDNPV